MKNKKKDLILILIVFVLLIAIVGISYAAFNYVGTGQKLNTITTGTITMEYVESTNVISMNNALPTTDSTGKKRLNDGEYFDFTVSTDKAAGFFAARSRRFGARRRVAKLIRQPPRFGASAAAGHKNDLSSRAHPAAR